MRRKKRLLFDVLDDVIEPRDRFDLGSRKKAKPARKEKRPKRREKADAAGPARKERESRPRGAAPKSPPVEGGVQLSYGMLGAVLFVLLVVVGVSYKFGLTHGESGVLSNEERSLPRKKGALPSRDRPHFSIQAVALSYSRASREACVGQAVDYVSFLRDRGYDDAVAMDMPDELNEQAGRVLVWVGQAGYRVDLREQAEKIRRLQYRGGNPFRDAYISLLMPPE